MLHVDPVLTRCVGIPAKAPYLWPPMGLAYLAGYVRQRFDVDFIDAQAEGLSKSHTLRRINHDIVFINAGMSTIESDLRLAGFIRSTGSRTVLIGTHATHFHRELIMNTGVDFVIRGEPEIPGIELASALEQGAPLSGVKGLTWKNSGNPVINSPQDASIDLDSIPHSVRDLMPNSRYYDILAKRRPLTFAITSRGCTYGCRFCSARIYQGRSFRARSAASVISEARESSDQNFRDISFLDDTFTLDKKRVIEICRGLGELDISWRCLSRTDTVDRRMLRAMRDSGCYQIQFGVESGDMKILQSMNKSASPDSARKAFSLCDRLGIETAGFFIAGYPGETAKSFSNTISLIRDIRPDFVSFNVFTPIPGSEDFERLKPFQDWDGFDFTSTSFCSMSSSALRSSISNAYRSYYLRPSYLTRRIAKTGEPARVLRQNLNFWKRRQGALWKSIFSICISGGGES